MSEDICKVEGCFERVMAREWCSEHYQRWWRTGDPLLRKRLSAEDRFWSYVDKTSSPIGCWLWTGTLSTAGYGRFLLNRRILQAHRVSYEWLVGPIPEWAATLDHACHTNDPDCPGGDGDIHRRCVFFEHLEPVTFAENLRRGQSPAANHARKTHCPYGHPYDEANTYWHPDGSRRCIKCQKLRYLRQKADLYAVDFGYVPKA